MAVNSWRRLFNTAQYACGLAPRQAWHISIMVSLSVAASTQTPWILLCFLFSRFSCVRLFATPLDFSPPGSSLHGISQARILEWVAMSFSSPMLQDFIKYIYILKFIQSCQNPQMHYFYPTVRKKWSFREVKRISADHTTDTWQEQVCLVVCSYHACPKLFTRKSSMILPLLP